jgi:hypothetical protein
MLMVTTARSHTLGLAHSCEWPLVEIQVGPHRIVSLMPAEVVDQLKLEPEAQAVASVISETAVICLERVGDEGPR